MKIALKLKIGIGLLGWTLALGLGATNNAFTIDPAVQQARSKAEAGDLEGAAAAYHKALKIDNTNEEARRGLADAIIKGQSNDPEAEHPDVLNGIVQDDEIQAALPSTQLPLSFLKNGSLGPLDSRMSAKVLVALTKLQNGDHDAALKEAITLQKKNPKHPVPYNLLGLAWQGKGDPSLARDFFKEALMLKKDFHAARINLAELELHLGEFSVAHQELQTVLKADKEDRRACLTLAHLFALEGKLQESEQWYQRMGKHF